MSKPISINLFSTKSIREAQKQLEEYKNSLPSKCEEFVRKLAEQGIQTAQSNVGNYGRYISFSIKLDPNTSGCTALMVATSTGKIRSQWQTKDGVKTADVDPLLMVEFGSGRYAENPKGIEGVGQGTFPAQGDYEGSTHAFDKEGWYWKDLNGEWHHSYGIKPSMPMYKASMDIIDNVNKIAKEVFGK